TVPRRRTPGPAARRTARRRGAPGAPRRPGPAHRASVHARGRRRAARGRPRLGGAVATVAAVVGAGHRGREPAAGDPGGRYGGAAGRPPAAVGGGRHLRLALRRVTSG